MTRTRRLAPAALALLSIVALDACRRKPAQTAPTTPTTTVDSSAIVRARQDSLARAERERFVQDNIARASASSRETLERARAALTAAVYFDYDSSDLREDSRASLDARVPVLRANTGVRLVIAGHTDERGASEYNLALGQRRAASVKQYLVDRGVDGSRIEIVSFGEERPASQGGGDDAYSRNRRAEFEVTAGAESLRVP